jgi:hypothetical protein
LFSPEYNSNPYANSRFGSKQSEETIKKISEAQSGKNNNFFGKTHSEETKFKMSIARGTMIYVYSLDL